MTTMITPILVAWRKQDNMMLLTKTTIIWIDSGPILSTGYEDEARNNHGFKNGNNHGFTIDDPGYKIKSSDLKLNEYDFKINHLDWFR